MAFNIKDYGSYGTGTLGSITDPTAQICSYANVTAYTPTTITIGTPSLGGYEKFVVGTEILVHVSGCLSGTTAEYLGKYMTCKITAITDSVLTVNSDFTKVLPVDQLSAHVVQIVSIAQFATLTLTSSTGIAPLVYNATTKYGGILALKCSTELVFNGGSIKLTDKGIPVASKALRYWTNQEDKTYNATVTTTTSDNGLLDADKYAGWENHITSRQLLLNAGDGIFFCLAKKITNTSSNASTRIGGTTAGIQYCRGASDSLGLVAGNTNIGGSTILLACDDFVGFVPSMISKVRTTSTLGQGLGRCYIACKNTKLKNDEGLYSGDVISDPLRMVRQCNIRDYGTGRHGTVASTPDKPVNNYASFTSIDTTGKIITYTNITTDGLATFDVGSTVMIHVSKVTNTDYKYIGNFMLAKVTAHDTDKKQITLDTSVLSILPTTALLASYNIQLISVYEPTTLTVNSAYKLTTVWDDTNKLGGICAIAAKNSIDISDGSIIVTDKGGNGTFTENDKYTYFGQTQCNNVLPLSFAGGAIFLLTPELKANVTSRLGNSWDGANISRYSGANGTAGNPGGAGGTCKRINSILGVSMMIIAKLIDGLNMHMLSTGGIGGYTAGSVTDGNTAGIAYAGGAGYAGQGGTGAGTTAGAGGIGGVGYFPGAGGGGGTVDTLTGLAGGASATAGAASTATQNGGGQGGFPSGYCFIYCNEIKNEDTTGVII